VRCWVSNLMASRALFSAASLLWRL
jgi:hypothetical protein